MLNTVDTHTCSVGTQFQKRVLRKLAFATHLSLDVFDTALLRKTFLPRDIFRTIEAETVAKHGRAFEGLSVARQEAERRADLAAQRRGWTGPGRHIDRIYVELVKIVPLVGPLVEQLKQRELALEARVLVRNEWCFELFTQARKWGKRVIFLSDMYLPHGEIAHLLEGAGYVGFDKLYVSATAGASKREGSLFDLVLDELGLHPSKVVHVGDCADADYRVPMRKGIQAVHIPPARERMLASARFSHLEDFSFEQRKLTQGDRLTLGLLAREELTPPVPGVESQARLRQRVGYQVLGPVQLAFALWIKERADALRVEDLFFVARDAWVTKLVFQELEDRGLCNQRIHYLHASRVSLFLVKMAEMETSEAVRDVFAELDYFGLHLTVARHLVRLGLRPETFRTRVERSPLGSLNRRVDDEKVRGQYFAFLREIESEIRAMVDEHCRAYSRYLEESGFLRSKRCALVDNTSSGRTFLRLRQLARKLGSDNELTAGLYTYVPNETMRMVPPGDAVEGWLYRHTDEGISAVDLDLRPLYEDLLLSSPEGSFVRAEARGEEGIELVFSDTCDVMGYEMVVRDIHDGALRFVRDFLDAAGDLGAEPPSRELVYAGLKRFIYAPTADEALHFKERYTGDWAAGKKDLIPMVPRVETPGVLLNPFRVRRDLRRAEWRFGYEATLPGYVRELMAGLRLGRNVPRALKLELERMAACRRRRAAQTARPTPTGPRPPPPKAAEPPESSTRPATTVLPLNGRRGAMTLGDSVQQPRDSSTAQAQQALSP